MGNRRQIGDSISGFTVAARWGDFADVFLEVVVRIGD
jgi:hypothetical protein